MKVTKKGKIKFCCKDAQWEGTLFEVDSNGKLTLHAEGYDSMNECTTDVVDIDVNFCPFCGAKTEYDSKGGSQ